VGPDENDDGDSLISIVMPVRNVEATIDITMRSLVMQSHTQWELVVIDDGSTDGTAAALRRWADTDARVRLHRGIGSRGVAARLNEAVELSRGSYIARMDGDDVSYPHRLATQRAFLDSTPDVDVVGAYEIVFRGDGIVRGTRVYPERHAEIVATPMKGIPVSHPVWLGRRSWFEHNRYDVRALSCEDQEVLLRARASSRYANIPEILLGYREDRLKLRSALRARWAQTAYLLAYGARNGGLPAAMLEAGMHAVKGLRDVLAVATGKEEAVLARRNRAATPGELAQWDAVWSALRAPSPAGPGQGVV
jgi:glycosyltransferase involved in cell wall biosynthesis